MEIDVKLKISQLVLVFLIPIGMEPLVSALLDSLEEVLLAIVMVLLLALIVKDVLPRPIQFIPMEFVNAILDM